MGAPVLRSASWTRSRRSLRGKHPKFGTAGLQNAGPFVGAALAAPLAGVGRPWGRHGSFQLMAGLVARMVEPIAPYFLALRRVSSNVERAYVSTRAPCVMSM
jgi:hypothetical protein